MKPSLLVPSVVFVVVAILGGFYLAQPNPLAVKVRELEGQLGKVQGENTRLKADNEKLQVAVKKAEQEVAKNARPGGPGMVAGSAGVGTIPGGGSGANGGAGGKAGVGMDGVSSGDGVVVVDQARVRDTMRKLNESQMDLNYGRLFKHLGLNEEETARFKQLLADRMNQQTEIGMKLTDKSLTQDQKKAITGEMTAAKKASDAAIRQFLDSDEDYNTFQQWEDTKVDRSQLQSMVANFDAADATLSTEQRDQLLAVMIATRKASNGRTRVLTGQANLNSANPNAIMDAVRAREATNTQTILQQAAAFLSPEQLGILEKSQKQRLEMFSNFSLPASAVGPAAPGTPAGPKK